MAEATRVLTQSRLGRISRGRVPVSAAALPVAPRAIRLLRLAVACAAALLIAGCGAASPTSSSTASAGQRADSSSSAAAVSTTGNFDPSMPVTLSASIGGQTALTGRCLADVHAATWPSKPPELTSAQVTKLISSKAGFKKLLKLENSTPALRSVNRVDQDCLAACRQYLQQNQQFVSSADPTSDLCANDSWWPTAPDFYVPQMEFSLSGAAQDASMRGGKSLARSWLKQANSLLQAAQGGH